jgi:hypothetical protein
MSPYKDGKPTLGEQFDDADAHQHSVDDYEPHKVSEPMNELEAYRHLQKVEAEHALFQDIIRELVRHAPILGASNRAYYAEHGMLCDQKRNSPRPCDCGWKEAEEAFARAEKLMEEVKKS